MYCAACGGVVAAGTSFCASCGAPAQAAMAGGAVAQANGGGPSGAGFWKRFVALLIDALILYLPLGVVQLVVQSVDPMLGALFYIPYLIAAWLYFALQESSSGQGTLGKRAMGIRVTDLEGRRIGFGRATARHVAALINYVTLYIGYAMAGWTRRKQGLHDMVASTLVVNRPGGGAMPGWAIGLLVVLVLLVPIGGVLAAIAIPAYQDYAVRVKVSHGLTLAAPLRLAYSETLLSEQRVPDSAADAGASPRSGELASVEIIEGLVVVTYAAGEPVVGGQTLALEPLMGENGSVRWVCGRAPAPAGRRIASASAADYTSIAARYLPAGCRD